MGIVSLESGAVLRLKQITEENPGKVIRLSVETMGCSGNKYSIDLKDEPGPHDEVVEVDGVSLFVDPLSLMYVAGTKIDWQESRFSRGFVFDNPNETGTCGCGESFTIQ